MLFITWSLIASAATAIMLLGIIQQVECRRFAKKRRGQTCPAVQPSPKITLVIPLCGLEHQLRDNLLGWLQQDYFNKEVVFVAEDESDPAVAVAQALMNENRFVPARILFSGSSKECGQGVHQLLFGCSHASDDTKILAFSGADSKPKTGALRWMAVRMADQRTGVVTGCRWSIPRHQSLANRLFSSLNNGAASMTGGGGTNPVSSGAFAIRKELFESLGLARVWSSVLSEEWSTMQAVKRAGKRVTFEPNCVVETTIEVNSSRLLYSFFRKCLVARVYAPMVWWPVLISILTVQTAFWGGIALATGLAIAGGGWQCWTVASVTLCLYGLGVAWGLIRNNTAKIHLPVWKQYRSARRFDSQAWPVSGLGGLLLMLVSLGVQSIYWRGNYWHVTANGNVRFEGKRPHENILRVGGREIPSPISKPDADAKKKQRAA